MAYIKSEKAITALREALTQPVSQDFEKWWEHEGQEFLYALNTTTDDDIKLVAEFAWKNGAYKAEQPVSRQSLPNDGNSEPVDSLIKRLRATPNWLRESFSDWKSCTRTYDRAPFEAADMLEKLHTTPQPVKQEVELTDDEIYEVCKDVPFVVIGPDYDLAIARAVIAADREKNK